MEESKGTNCQEYNARAVEPPTADLAAPRAPRGLLDRAAMEGAVQNALNHLVPTPAASSLPLSHRQALCNGRRGL